MSDEVKIKKEGDNSTTESANNESQFKSDDLRKNINASESDASTHKDFSNDEIKTSSEKNEERKEKQEEKKEEALARKEEKEDLKAQSQSSESEQANDTSSDGAENEQMEEIFASDEDGDKAQEFMKLMGAGSKADTMSKEERQEFIRKKLQGKSPAEAKAIVGMAILKIKNSEEAKAAVKVVIADLDPEQQEKLGQLVGAKNFTGGTEESQKELVKKMFKKPPKEVSKLVALSKKAPSKGYKFRVKSPLDGSESQVPCKNFKEFLFASNFKTMEYNFDQDWDAALAEVNAVKEFLEKIKPSSKAIELDPNVMLNLPKFRPDCVVVKNLWIQDEKTKEYKLWAADKLTELQIPTNPSMPEEEPTNYDVEDAKWLKHFVRISALAQIEAGILKPEEDYDYAVPDIKEHHDSLCKNFLESLKTLGEHFDRTGNGLDEAVNAFFRISELQDSIKNKIEINSLLGDIQSFKVLLRDQKYKIQPKSDKEYLEAIDNFISSENYQITLESYSEFSDCLPSEQEQPIGAKSSSKEEMEVLVNSAESQKRVKDELSQFQILLLKNNTVSDVANTDNLEIVKAQNENSAIIEKKQPVVIEEILNKNQVDNLVDFWLDRLFKTLKEQETNLKKSLDDKYRLQTSSGESPSFDDLMASFEKQEILSFELFKLANLANLLDKYDESQKIEFLDNVSEVQIKEKLQKIVETAKKVIRNSVYVPQDKIFSDFEVFENLLIISKFKKQPFKIDAVVNLSLKNLLILTTQATDAFKRMNAIDSIQYKDELKLFSLNSKKFDEYKLIMTEAVKLMLFEKKAAMDEAKKQAENQKSEEELGDNAAKGEESIETQPKEIAAPKTIRFFASDPYIRDAEGKAVLSDSGRPYVKSDIFNRYGFVNVNRRGGQVILIGAVHYNKKMYGLPADYEGEPAKDSYNLSDFNKLPPEQQKSIKESFAPKVEAVQGQLQELERWVSDKVAFNLGICLSANWVRKAISATSLENQSFEDQIDNDLLRLSDSSNNYIKSSTGLIFNINSLQFDKKEYYIDMVLKKEIEESELAAKNKAEFKEQLSTDKASVEEIGV